MAFAALSVYGITFIVLYHAENNLKVNEERKARFTVWKQNYGQPLIQADAVPYP